MKEKLAKRFFLILEIHLSECSIDLAHFKKKEQRSSAKTLAQQEASKPFVLASEPLIRVKLLLLSKKEHILLITMHHIISDGWSMGIFFKELSALYNAYCLKENLPFLLYLSNMLTLLSGKDNGSKEKSLSSSCLTGKTAFRYS